MDLDEIMKMFQSGSLYIDCKDISASDQDELYELLQGLGWKPWNGERLLPYIRNRLRDVDSPYRYLKAANSDDYGEYRLSCARMAGSHDCIALHILFESIAQTEQIPSEDFDSILN